ncbi:response regulator transcription factor [Actinocorallia libanotica]|uniref:Response regulator transcription factor n=1 Tax=Actinocorallia libanotica TaxID=46162 RepID=A0ABN1RFB6_9ACTN
MTAVQEQAPLREDDSVPLLLVADPDERLGHDLILALTGRGIEVAVCTDGAEALLRVGSLNPDVLIISAGLPTVGAAAFVKAVRTRYQMPVILGIGADDAEEAVRALAAGANLCVARPYRLDELLPLITGVRPETQTAAQLLTCGGIDLDSVSHVVRVDTRPVHLPLREYELLHYLMLHAGKVVTRQQIQIHVWRSDKVMTNTIAVHIRRLRERLGDDPENPRIILTVRGIGYRLACP